MSRMLMSMAALMIGAGVLCAQEAKKTPAPPPDAVETLIQKALQDYKAGQTRDAIAALQKAINQMQASVQKGLASFFPAPPAGWEADEIDAQSGNWGGEGQTVSWTLASREYRRKDSSTTVSVQFTDSPELVQPQKEMAEMYANPEMLKAMNSNPNMKFEPVKRDGWVGWTLTDKEAKTVQTTAMQGGILLMAQVTDGDAGVMKAFLDAIDLKGLAEQAKQSKRP